MNVSFLHKLTRVNETQRVGAVKCRMEYRAEKSTDTLIADYANFSHLITQCLSRKNGFVELRSV